MTSVLRSRFCAFGGLVAAALIFSAEPLSALCERTSGASDITLWNSFGMTECNAFSGAHVGLYKMPPERWAGRDFGQCVDANSEFAKHLMAGMFLRSGIILDPGADIVDPGRNRSPFYFHDTVADWAAMSLARRSNFHTQLTHIPEDSIEGGALASWRPSLGDDAIRTSCKLYTFLQRQLLASDPAIRGAQFVHEAMHATLASQGFDPSHVADKTGPNCLGGDCDYFTLHGRGEYPAGQLAVQKWESRDGRPPFFGEFTGHVEHKAYQAEMEYECDVANTELLVGTGTLTSATGLLTKGMATNASNWAQARLATRFLGTVPSIACGCTTSMCAGIAGPVVASGGLQRVAIVLEGQMYESCEGFFCDNLSQERMTFAVSVGPSRKVDAPEGARSRCLGGEVFYTMQVKGEFFAAGEARPNGTGLAAGDEVWVLVDLRFNEEDGADQCRTGDCEEDLSGQNCPGPGVWFGPLSAASPSTWSQVLPVDLDNRSNEGGDDFLQGTLTLKYGW